MSIIQEDPRYNRVRPGHQAFAGPQIGSSGMSLRTYIATQTLAALIPIMINHEREQIAKEAVRQTDELIKALNKIPADEG